ncbi:MAG: hypothetical protein IJ057_09405 [Bacteroidales bacterium]|nr:hypothetical protein [Bacteroidales bacterium]
MVIILKPTYSCNFRCKYCYLSNETKTHKDTFSLAFAKQIVLQIKDYLKNPSAPKGHLHLAWRRAFAVGHRQLP